MYIFEKKIIRNLCEKNKKIPLQILKMLLKSYYNVKNLEIPENGPELPLPPYTRLKNFNPFL